MAAETIVGPLAAWLLQATLALTVALALLLALRRPLRRAFGARIAYAAWSLAPACLLALLLPLPALAPRVFAFGGDAARALPALVATVSAPVAEGVDTRAWLVAGWALGAMAMAWLFARRQRSFDRRILRRPGERWDEVAGHGPAVTGLLQPRILLPQDFDARYTRHEQLLVLAHERLHVLRGDVAAQAVASALRCLFWFHPLVHAAASAFRFDQELACDADVLARFPGSRRAYGDAMLKTQLADAGLPIGCHWQSSHPLKERLTMLKQPIPGALRRHAGHALVATLVASAAVTAWAAKPADSPAERVVPASSAAPGKHATPAPDTAPGIGHLTDKDDMAPPAYPASALAQHLEGKVVLLIDIDAAGNVTEVKVKSATPPGVFDAAATEAARKWHFNTARDVNGKPVSGWVEVPVEFAAHDPALAAAPKAAQHDAKR